MTGLRLELLGGFGLFIEGRRSRDPRAKKARALFAYLALHGGRMVARDQLAALLWSHSDHQHARHSLSQALSSVRRVFDAAGNDGLEIVADHACLDTAALDVDAHVFAALAASGEADSVERAVALYRGDLLAGLHVNDPCFQAWLSAEQQRFREIAVTAFGAALETQEKDGRLDDAVGTALALLALDSFSERTHRALMRIHAAQGRTDAALRQFRALQQLLRSELAAEPEAETLSLVQSITRARTLMPVRRQFENPLIPPADQRPSVVVLPFADYSPDRGPDRLADGLTDDLISDLSRINGALVIARNTAFTYKDRRVGVHRIATDLGVRYVIEGSVRRSGSRVQVNVRLVDGTTENHIWSDRFDRNIENAFFLQNQITGRVAAVLRLELLKAESHRLRHGPPDNLTAWGYAVRGWAELWTKTIRRDGTLEAQQLFERALELDPKLALAWTGMARVQYIAALYPFGIGQRVDSFRRALAAAETAVALDPGSAEAYAELGAALKTQYRYDEAEKALQTAIELNPNYEEAYCNLAMFKQATGEFGEALPLFKRSLILAPHLPTDSRRAFFIAQTYLLAGDRERALAFANKSAVADAEFPGPHWIRASVFGLQGRKDQAKAALAALLTRDRDLSTVEQVSRQYQYIAGMESALEGLLRAGMPEK